MKTKFFTFTFFALLAAFMFCVPEAFAVGQSPDTGLNTSVGDLVSILNNNLVPVILICGCLAGVALSFIKSSPAPFVIALITTISFGFAKAWINTTYAICM
ncbi:MAG: hypothetical protein BGO67_10545 [Alphaproteobacteria bacterium 41-28]|nr:MAG: hypothetical protein BGO67_10545 [Alphaproteobacteria bacterium 41-28]